MKTFKLTLAATFLASAAFVIAHAAEAQHASHAATEVAAKVTPQRVIGSPRGLANWPSTPRPAANTDPTTHCKTAKSGQHKMSCCN